MLKNIRLIISLVSLLVYSLSSFSNQNITTIESLEWKNRIILIRENKDCKSTITRLKQAKIEIDERHILWFISCNQRHFVSNFTGEISVALPNSIKQKYFSNNKHNVVLIGKDGGVKYRSQKLHLNEINTLIDSMPMRQAEMREGEN